MFLSKWSFQFSPLRNHKNSFQNNSVIINFRMCKRQVLIWKVVSSNPVLDARKNVSKTCSLIDHSHDAQIVKKSEMNSKQRGLHIIRFLKQFWSILRYRTDQCEVQGNVSKFVPQIDHSLHAQIVKKIRNELKTRIDETFFLVIS